MLEIIECKSLDKYKTIIENISSDLQIYVTEADDKGTLIGYVAYAYGKECVYIYDFDDGGDIMLCDGLIRSVLLKASLKSIEEAVFEINDEEKLKSLRVLKFIPTDGIKLNYISDFMNNCKKCKEFN